MKIILPLIFKVKLNFTEEETKIMEKLITHKINQEDELKEMINGGKNKWAISAIEYNGYHIQFEFNTVKNTVKINSVKTEEQYALLKEVFKVQKEEKKD